MRPGGDYLVVQHTEGKDPFAIDLDVTGSSGTVSAVVPGRTNYKLRIQTITVSYIAHVAAGTITFQDNGTPVKIAKLTDQAAAAGVPDVVFIDFGPHGTELTQDKQLDVVVSGTGPSARIHIEGYYHLAAVISVSTNTNTGTATASS